VVRFHPPRPQLARRWRGSGSAPGAPVAARAVLPPVAAPGFRRIAGDGPVPVDSRAVVAALGSPPEPMPLPLASPRRVPGSGGRTRDVPGSVPEVKGTRR
jgi:hypothetical protein